MHFRLLLQHPSQRPRLVGLVDQEGTEITTSQFKLLLLCRMFFKILISLGPTKKG